MHLQGMKQFNDLSLLSLAGILYVPPLDCVSVFQNSVFNATLPDLETCCYDLYDRFVQRIFLLCSDLKMPLALKIQKKPSVLLCVSALLTTTGHFPLGVLGMK